jgi:hypothetical protein
MATTKKKSNTLCEATLPATTETSQNAEEIVPYKKINYSAQISYKNVTCYLSLAGFAFAILHFSFLSLRFINELQEI